MERPRPAQETEKDRFLANRALRALVEAKLKKHGLRDFTAPGLVVTDCPVALRDGRIGHLLWFKGKAETDFSGIDRVVIKVYKTEDLAGSCTDYISHKPGVFIREDNDPSPSAIESDFTGEEVMGGDQEKILDEQLLAFYKARSRKWLDIIEGIDGQPITAEEAREVRLFVAGSSVYRQ